MNIWNPFHKVTELVRFVHKTASGKPERTTRIYCPQCKMEMLDSDSFQGEVRNADHFICTGCKRSSLWLLDTPVPVLVNANYIRPTLGFQTPPQTPDSSKSS